MGVSFEKEPSKNMDWPRAFLCRGHAALRLVRCRVERLPAGRSGGRRKPFLHPEGPAHDFVHLAYLHLCACLVPSSFLDSSMKGKYPGHLWMNASWKT